MAEGDGSEDVNDFLQRIKALGEKRDKEDEERTRKLEEEILKGRKERQARRAERARSISPTKDSPISSTTPTSQRISQTDTPLQQKPARAIMESSPSLSSPAGGIETSETRLNVARSSNDRGVARSSFSSAIEPTKPTPPSSTTRPLSRSGTLSWQQRPSSRGSTGTTSRPLSTVAAENNIIKSPRATLDPMSTEEKESSRSQIAQSLGSKDPAWFRQTAERGLGSAAYRKNQDGTASDMTAFSGSKRLPGFSKASTADFEREFSSQPDSLRSSSPSRDSSLQGSQKDLAIASGHSTSALVSPLPVLNSQRFEPPRPCGTISSSSEAPSSRSPAMSPSQGRISPGRAERPSSPTKGLGGFVQSAMMKRSDSVNKRWSAQAGPGLSRGNSIASNRGGSEYSRTVIPSISPPRDLQRGSLSRETSPVSSSRPGSSHNNASLGRDTDKSAAFTPKKPDANTFIKPALPGHVRTSLNEPRTSNPQPAIQTSPPSPSKRWSPTKASWLETAINKPETPKPKLATPQQPSWVADINRAKQARGSVDLGKGTAFKEVSTAGFIRSPPMTSPIKSTIVGDTASTLSSSKMANTENPNTSGNNRDSKLGLSDDFEPKSPEATKTTMRNPAQSEIISGSNSHVGPNISLDTPFSKSTKISESQKSPVMTKTKPDIPPKVDFRSALKSRQVSDGSGKKDEAEFKSVFGKLKRTETKNYVAPDELKHNILLGKAGLALTGGPKKTERVDELKESILKKKEEWKSQPPGSSTRKTSGDASREIEVPEAIAKRQGMATRINSVTSNDGPATAKVAEKNSPSGKSRASLPAKKATASEAPEVESIVSGKLAGRFNPALANILARGPSPITKSPDIIARTELSGTSNSTNVNSKGEAPLLTHMTKERARGPKRRAPRSVPTSEIIVITPTITPKPNLALEVQSKASEKSVALESLRNQVDETVPLSLLNVTNSSKPTKPTASAERIPSLSPTKDTPTLASDLPSIKSFNVSTVPKNSKKSSTSLFRGEATKEASLSSQGTKPSLENVLEDPVPNSTPKPLSDMKTPVKSIAAAKEISSPKLSGNIISPVVTKFAVSKPQQLSGTSSPVKSPRSPPIPSKKPDLNTNLNRMVSNGSMTSVSSKAADTPVPRISEAARLFLRFFDENPATKTKIEVDTQPLLASPHPGESGKIKTLRKQIWEITGDGKREPIPAQQEHILFEDSMYLCSHVFGTTSGKRITEVYLWCGDGVSPSAVEDAQLFSRNAAKEAGGKLILLSQGKESSNFFEALGGIVITRRNASRSDASATYMLCGRRHMGQIAFDEVTYSPSSLCSGFPFIIAATGGRLLLWKGKGSGADELGCARLIGMDLGLTGEIEEIDEGREDLSFWNAFPLGTKYSPLTSGHWHLKGANEKYATRLFAVDFDARPRSISGFGVMWGRRGSTPADNTMAEIKEMTPFAQSDLARDGIFVLDAYFEIYVIVGATATSKVQTFRAALLFAQEYGILAASMQDRPFIPASTVVLEGAPRNLKMAFRKWDEGRAVTKACASGEEATVIPLHEAIEATSV